MDAHGAAAAVFAERTPAAVLADGASFALLAGGAYLYICMQILYTDTNTHTHSHTHTQCVCKSTLSCSQTWEPPQSRQRYFRRLCGHMYRELSHFFGALPLTSVPVSAFPSFFLSSSSGGGGAQARQPCVPKPPCRCVCAPGAGAKISGAFPAGGDE